MKSGGLMQLVASGCHDPMDTYGTLNSAQFANVRESIMYHFINNVDGLALERDVLPVYESPSILDHVPRNLKPPPYDVSVSYKVRNKQENDARYNNKADQYMWGQRSRYSNTMPPSQINTLG